MKAEPCPLPPPLDVTFSIFIQGLHGQMNGLKYIFFLKKSLVRAAVNTEMMFLPHHRTLDFDCDVRPQHRHLW